MNRFDIIGRDTVLSNVSHKISCGVLVDGQHIRQSYYL